MRSLAMFVLHPAVMMSAASPVVDAGRNVRITIAWLVLIGPGIPILLMIRRDVAVGRSGNNVSATTINPPAELPGSRYTRAMPHRNHAR